MSSASLLHHGSVSQYHICSSLIKTSLSLARWCAGAPEKHTIIIAWGKYFCRTIEIFSCRMWWGGIWLCCAGLNHAQSYTTFSATFPQPDSHQDPGSLTARNQFETFGCLLEIKEYGGQKCWAMKKSLVLLVIEYLLQVINIENMLQEWNISHSRLVVERFEKD